MNTNDKNLKIAPLPAAAVGSVGIPTVWQADNFAEDWFTDALAEAQRGANDHQSRRRGIIFAVCFAESYIFEWGRRQLQIEEIGQYFPQERRFSRDPRYRRSVVEQWRALPKDLYDAGKISQLPKLDLSMFSVLVDYRNGLVHAHSSRPRIAGQPVARAIPTKEVLAKLESGWAVKIVADLVTDFHRGLGTPLPTYLQML